MGFFCLASFSSTGKLNGHLLKAEDTARENILVTARREIGIRELTGNNDGERVIAFLKSVKLKSGDPWCAAFISWVYRRNGYTEPTTGWSPAMFPSSRTLPAIAKNAAKANVLGIYIAAKKRIAHVGIVESCSGEWVTSIEGNTNSAGSNEGDGVYRKIRHIKTIRSFADWIKTERPKR
jgi:hypothetical protein